MKTYNNNNSVISFKIHMDQKPHDYRFRDLHDIARMIFDFLVRLKGLENESIALCTSDGSVLLVSQNR